MTLKDIWNARNTGAHYNAVCSQHADCQLTRGRMTSFTSLMAVADAVLARCDEHQSGETEVVVSPDEAEFLAWGAAYQGLP